MKQLDAREEEKGNAFEICVRYFSKAVQMKLQKIEFIIEFTFRRTMLSFTLNRKHLQNAVC